MTIYNLDKFSQREQVMLDLIDCLAQEVSYLEDKAKMLNTATLCATKASFSGEHEKIQVSDFCQFAMDTVAKETEQLGKKALNITLAVRGDENAIDAILDSDGEVLYPKNFELYNLIDHSKVS